MPVQPPSAATPASVGSARAPEQGAPDGPQRHDWRGHGVLRWVHPLGVAVFLVVVAAGASTEPRPALHGPGLAVLVALLGILGGGIWLFAGRRAGRLPVALEVMPLSLLIVSSGTLVWLQPDGPGFLGGFVAAGAAAWRLPRRWGVLVVALAMAVLAVAGLAGSHRPLMSIIMSELGAIAFYRVGVSSRLLRERTERSATLAERQRLAREMHDVLAHSLSGLVVHLEGARLLAARDAANPELADAVERAHHLAQSGLGEARQAIGMLRDADLPGPERLRALAQQFERDTGVPCALTVSGTVTELASQARLTVYRVAQEALTNVRKHAQPSRVELHLAYRPDGTSLTVTDVAEQHRRREPGGDHGYGVSGMRERAELLGGTLVAEPTDRGFRVALWLPA